MDVITPAGVVQSNELDYTLHTPVVLTGVVHSVERRGEATSLGGVGLDAATRVPACRLRSR